jgi:hypothetical protein
VTAQPTLRPRCCPRPSPNTQINARTLMLRWVLLYFPTRSDIVSQPARAEHIFSVAPSSRHSRTWRSTATRGTASATARHPPSASAPHLPLHVGHPLHVLVRSGTGHEDHLVEEAVVR